MDIADARLRALADDHRARRDGRSDRGLGDGMMHIALFRNLNLGHRGSPTGDELVDAFGGPTVARNFQTNGTIIFTSDAPETTATEATQALRHLGYQQGMVVRSLTDIEQAVADTHEPAPHENVYRTMVSFFGLERLPAVTVPARSRDGLAELRRLDDRSASSVCWKPRNNAGDVTGFLESLLDTQITSRTLGTMNRLLTTTRRITTTPTGRARP
jgi:uncharacterized protein (DUF1697 family)